MGSIPTSLQASTPVIPNTFFNEKFESFDELTIDATDTQASPEFLAKWRIDKDPSETITKQIKFGGNLSLLATRDTGAGFVIIDLMESFDNDVTYNSISSLQIERNVNSYALIQDVQDLAVGLVQLASTHLAFGIHNNDGVTTGRMKEIIAQLFCYLPLNYKLTRLI
jgi:hypothetical protein